MGGMTALGAVLGLICLGFFLPTEDCYLLYAAAILFSTPLTWWAAQEVPLEAPEDNLTGAWNWTEIAKAYYISERTHGDFYWIFVSRTFYYMAVSAQIYILYYLRDTIPDPKISNNAKSYTAILCILSQGASGLVSLTGSSVAGLIGRKNAIYIACTVMAGVYVGYCFAHEWNYIVLLGVCYGAGNGIYISVDYALAVECLPNAEKESAKDLALWGIAAFMGTMFGPCLCGPALYFFGHEDNSTHYAFPGYVAIMLIAVVYSFGCALALVKVSKGNAGQNPA